MSDDEYIDYPDEKDLYEENQHFSQEELMDYLSELSRPSKRQPKQNFNPFRELVGGTAPLFLRTEQDIFKRGFTLSEVLCSGQMRILWNVDMFDLMEILFNAINNFKLRYRDARHMCFIIKKHDMEFGDFMYIISRLFVLDPMQTRHLIRYLKDNSLPDTFQTKLRFVYDMIPYLYMDLLTNYLRLNPDLELLIITHEYALDLFVKNYPELSPYD